MCTVRTVRTAAALAAAAALLLSGAASCSGPGDRARTPQEAFRAAAEVMTAAGAARIALETQDPVDGLRSGGGVLSWGDKPAMDVTMRGSSGDLKVRTLDGVVYLGADRAQADRMGGRRWMTFDPRSSSGDGGGAAAFSTWSERLNPVSDLTGLAEAGRLRRVGEDRLDNEETVHYRATASLDAMVAAGTGLTAAQRLSVLDMYRKQGATSITADFWINGRDEVVQAWRDCRTAKGRATTATRYSGIGIEVNIQAPLPDDTFDAQDLLDDPQDLPKDATG